MTNVTAASAPHRSAGRMRSVKTSMRWFELPYAKLELLRLCARIGYTPHAT